MYSEMVAVQLDEVHRALMSSVVLTVIIGQESFGDVVDGSTKETTVSFFFQLSLGPLPESRGTSNLVVIQRALVSASLGGTGKPRPPLFPSLQKALV